MPVVWIKHDGHRLFLSTVVITSEQLELIDLGRDVGGVVDNQSFKTLVDTGATCTCITAAGAVKAGLKPIGKVPIQGVSGVQMHNNYLFYIGFAMSGPTADESLAVAGRKAVELHVLPTAVEGAELNKGDFDFDLLLGMDVLRTGQLIVTRDSFCWAW